MWNDEGRANITYVEGVSAQIKIQHADLCTNSNGSIFNNTGNTSSAWSMIAEDDDHAEAAGRGSGLAQVGFIQTPAYHDDPVYFYEDGATDTGGTYHYWHPWTTRAPQEVHTFAVLWSATCSCLQESIDGVVVHQTSWNPYSANVWGAPSNTNRWQTQFFGETHDHGTDMPGNNTEAATVYSNIKTQNSQTDVVGPVACALHGANDENPSRYGINGSGGYGCAPFSIFTN